LTLHRVVSRNQTAAQQRKPIILQHGLFGSAELFLVNSPHLHTNDSKYGDTLGFALMLTGRYDVWLPNSRGNGHSQTHVRLLPGDDRFWAFSFDQMAQYDLPAVIDYVRKATNRSKVAY